MHLNSGVSKQNAFVKLTMIGIPRLLEILQLSSEKGSAVEVILQDFFELGQTDRGASLTTTAESLFLLVFGDDATICSNPHFAERNSTVWLGAPRHCFQTSLIITYLQQVPQLSTKPRYICQPSYKPRCCKVACSVSNSRNKILHPWWWTPHEPWVYEQ